ncbi:MAG TPA: hypothetical protein VN645_10160 [Steroidobacteraceae bacterium]|nr:hypothetical protein [Steroidobacteraceae bacterium]
MESSEKSCSPPAPRNHEDLLSLAAQRVRDGTLPRDYEARLFAGPGRGMSCALCGDAIGLTDIEYEVDSNKFESPANPARFHRACYFAWLQACE